MKPRIALDGEHMMIDPKHCPFCRAPATTPCPHLALASEGRYFVHRCVEHCQGQRQWREFCHSLREHSKQTGEWSPDQEDFTWLETAFCDQFLRRLRWFGGMDHEWRRGAFYVLLWSRDPQRLWWELRDEFERQTQSILKRPLPAK